MKASNHGAATPLFVYGSLLEPARRIELLGRDIRATPARLSRYRVIAARYFYVVADPGAETAGIALWGLAARDFELLDRYEEVPRLYRREQITATTQDGTAHRCWIYLPTRALTDEMR